MNECKIITSPTIVANKTPNQKTVIGYSTAATRHENDYTSNTTKLFSNDATYYAQSRRDVTVSFKVN